MTSPLNLDDLSVDAHAAGLLAPYGGVRPPAPPWFNVALAYPKSAWSVVVEGARVEGFAWGPLGAPGLLFLHGNGAHAGWWDAFAPAFAVDRRVAAFSWSGMGGSDWRRAYSVDHFVAEVMAAAEAAGLFKATRRPIVAAHSFGGFPAMAAAARFGESFEALITLDSPIFPPGMADRGPPVRSGPNRIYPSLEAALARFRLAPPQACDQHYLIDHIARGSIKTVEGGYTWRFDPFLWSTLHGAPMAPNPSAAKCRLGVMWGENSVLCTPAVIAHMKSVFPPDAVFTGLPGAAHHLMLDQPDTFVSTLKTMLAALDPQP